jgi:PAS domain S-box-containing protein
MKKGILAASLGLTGLLGLGALASRGALAQLFSENYLPHRFCYLAQPGLVWTNVISDGLIAASYTSLFLCILLITRQLRGVPPLKSYLWILLSFAAFIMACGFTHYMDVVTIWWPFYPMSAAMKVLCAALSVPTAVMFARVTPVIVSNIVHFFELLHNAQLAVIVAEDCRDQIEAINRSQMMIEFNMDGTIVRANDAALSRFGYTEEQMLGRDHSILLREEDKRSRRHQEFWEQLRNGNFQSGEFRRVGADGREIWVEERYTPIRGTDGVLRKVVAFATDETQRVTRRTENERRIRQAEAQLKAILDNVVVGIVLIDEAGTVASFNRAAVHIFGCEPEEAVGKNIATFVPGEAFIPTELFLAGHPGLGVARETSPSASIPRELEGVASDGRRFPVEVTVSEVARSERRMFVALVRDITQRKQADAERQRHEEALRRSEEMLERTGRLAGIGGWELDLATSQLTWSAETYHILGARYTYQPTLAEALDMYPENYRKLLVEAIDRAQADGQGWDIEVPARTMDGRDIWARAVGVAEFANGKPVRLVGAFQDITARVASRKALDEANLRASLAAESGFIGVWDWDISARTLVWDDWMWRLYGMEPKGGAPIPFRAWIERICAEDRAGVEQSIQDVVIAGKRYDHQFRTIWSDGTLHYLRATGKVITDASGQAVRMVGHNIDITARKLAEEALRKSQAFLERTGNLAGVGGWEIDLATNQVTWSPETYRILGADPSYKPTLDEAIELYAPESKPVIRAAIAKAYTHGEGWDLELQLVGLDGRQMWARAVGVVDFANGQPVRLWGAFQDITARVAERQALQEANTRAAIAAESGGIGIWDWNVATNDFTCDAMMYRIYGLRPDVKGRFDFEFWAHRIHPEDRLFTEPALREAMEGGRSFDLEFRIVWNNGTVRHVRATAKIFHDRGLRPIRVVGTNTDITDRVAEREALKVANTRAALATESGGIGIWHRDVVTNQIAADPWMCRLWGLTPGDERRFDFEFWQQHLHPEDSARVKGALAAAIAGEQPYEIEFRIVWDDGSVHWIRAAAQVTRAPDGTALSMTGTNMDVSERVVREEALREANTRARLATESGGIGIWDWNLATGKLTADDGMYRIVGLDPDQYPLNDYEEWASHVHPDDRARVEQELKDGIEEKAPYDTEFRILWADRSLHHIKATGQVVHDAAGKPRRMVGTNKDITAQKQAEEELRLSGEKEKLLIQGIKDYAILMLDAEGRVTTWNEGAERIKGYTANEIIGCHFSKFYPARDIAEGKPQRELEIARAEGKYEEEGIRLRKDGSEFWASVIITSLRDENGQLRGFGKVTRDITARRMLELESQHARIEAEKANSAKSDFLANMSHEVRTPVNAIIGMTHLALRADPPPKQRNYLAKIDTAAGRLLHIMNDILDFSKIEAGKLTLERIVFPFEEVLKNLRDIVGQKATEKGLHLHFAVEPEVPTCLTGDPLRLGKVLVNLVNNAIKFTERGEISLKVSLADSSATSGSGAVKLKFSVTDTGIGMTPAQMANLFQAFNQADTSFTRQYGGTGLGLAISRQLVELMDGRIWVESEFGHGTTFHFTSIFGIDDAQTQLPDPSSAVGAAPNPGRTGGQCHVLVVDDSKDARHWLVKILDDHGHLVRGVSSGEEAIAAVIAAAQAGNPYDLILMDWRLPGIHGVEAARRIKDNSSLAKVPAIVMLSAFARDEVLGESDDIPLEGFLMKPVTEAQLLKTVAAFSTGEPAGAPLEAAATVQPQSSDDTKPEISGPLAGRRVLLVEDNDLNRELATELLGDLGISVTIAENGRDAVDMVDARSFDLILMDIQMPVMDGLTATKLIRADTRFAALPIIAMTAHAMTGDRERSLSAGMNDHLTKPVDPAALNQILLRWMPAAAPSPSSADGDPDHPDPMDGIPAQLPPFDISAALIRTNNKPKLLRKILLGFREQYAGAAAELRTHILYHKIEQAERLAHSLKSIAAMLGATNLTEAAASLEATLRDKQSSTQADDLAPLLGRLEQALVPAIEAAATLDRRAPDMLTALDEASSSTRPRHSILIIDDEPLVVSLLADTFQDYKIITAQDGPTALEMALLARPEMILLDVNMPGIDGFEVCRRLKEDARTREIPVIFITGSGDVTSETRGLKLGAVDYVAKPMNPAVLRARVSNQFKLKRAQVDLLRLLAKKYLDDMVDELERSAAQDRNRELQLQMKDDFLSHVSHELRSPLASIYSFISLVADEVAGNINDQQDEYLGIALMNVEQLKAMINDLLESTRLRTGKLAVDIQEIAVPDAVRYAVRSLEEAAKAKSITLSSRVEEGLASAHADPTRLRQSLIILIDNAIKFTPTGGRITVNARPFEKDPSFVLVEVADTGRGISPELTGHIFEHLFQVEDPNQGARTGLGLGLHIARELVRRQGGEIWVNSTVGEGSTFCFTVPTSPPAARELEEAA